MVLSSPSWPSIIDMSMRWPSPVRSLTRSASMMPKAAYMPAVMSAIEVPQRTPWLPSSPVMLIMPLSA